MTVVSMGQAINQALRDAMAEDERVVLIGEDIGIAGGAFGVTRRLRDGFPGRVLDTPISEAVITGASVGAALSGLRPVVEIMFMDFITLAMDQIVNQAAKAHFMFGGQASVPMVIRTPHGAGQNAGPQHSQNLEAWLAHVPGLVVVCPSTPQDAYGLLRSAIDCPDPVVFIENKTTYGLKGELDPVRLPIGKGHVVRAGRDVTVVSYGSAVRTCLSAAGRLAQSGVELEVIDLRSLQPWDRELVLASVARTHRAVVVHEAVTSYGPGAEIAATIGADAFDELDAPVLRVGAAFMPPPFAPSLQDGWLPSEDGIVTAVERVMA